MEEVTADVVELARELKLEMEPEVVAKLLWSHDKNLNRWEAASQGWANKVVSWDGISPPPREDAVGIPEIMTRNLKYSTISGEPIAGFGRADSNSLGKILSNCRYGDPVNTQAALSSVRHCQSHLSLHEPHSWPVHGHSSKVRSFSSKKTMIHCRLRWLVAFFFKQ